MVWDGVIKLTRLGDNAVKLVITKLDADNEETYTLFPIDADVLGFIPRFAKLESTHAAAVTYDLALQGSQNATTWTDILSNTAKDTLAKTTVDYTSAVGDPNPASFPHYRILLPDATDGAGTEHTATVFLWN